MTPDQIRSYGDELLLATRERRTVAPLTTREPGITIDDAYRISQHQLSRRLAEGDVVAGKKIGITSKAVMNMLDVREPDFGFLTGSMFVRGNEIPISQLLIQPRAEGEIGFVLEHDLMGPGITAEAVLAATKYLVPCFEIVDSRIADWKIRIQDTIADNASCGLFSVGTGLVDPRTVDLETCGTVLWKNGEVVSTGAGAAVLGSPLNSVAWLANALGAYGMPLKADELILSGSPVPLEPVKPGDEMRLAIGGVGTGSVRFV